MNFISRLEVQPINHSSNLKIIGDAKQYLDIELESIYMSHVYWFDSNKNLFPVHEQIIANEILHDSVIEILLTKDSISTLEQEQDLDYDSVLEIRFKPGVTDNAAHATLDAISMVIDTTELQVYTGVLYFMKGDMNKTKILALAKELLGNSLLNSFEVYTCNEFNNSRFENIRVPIVNRHAKPIQHYNIDNIEHALKLSTENCWALNKEELIQVQEHYAKTSVQAERKRLGLNKRPTDVEMEVIAQSWSEHCKHKIFAANITYQEDQNITQKKLGNLKIESLYKSFIKKATHDIKENRKLDWLISVFSDNAGIVRFDENIDLCIKVETHNSPSTLDPYGGALTGILGVNRDILGCGIGAKPIANMDVFCLAHESMIEQGILLPKGLKHPQRILEGVHKGVEDGGNKSGVPTVNGSIFFDDDYAGKPLIFVGTVGAMPAQTKHYKSSAQKEQKTGDYIVVVGGRIGADGIHGATFSSLELNEDSPATAVQIGDPITQKKVMDFMLIARDQGLFTSVTDNGAGGLSSSIGEMAEATNGASIDLMLAPTKYPGLSPFELMISESQERMTFSVAPDKIDSFQKLAKTYNVESTVLGKFTSTGNLEIKYDDKIVALLNLDFLHNSLRPMELPAKFDPNLSTTTPIAWHGRDLRLTNSNQLDQIITTIISRPNIQSKEKLVRQYDHEVQAATVVKPFTGLMQDGPSDSGVIWLKPHGGEEKKAIAISNGLQPLFSHQDAYVMALASVDEAVRNIISTGANPEKIVLLDNFCWPDPIQNKNNPDFSHKMAQLVRACSGLYEIATCYGMPFVSGKDSMKNDYSSTDANGNITKISVPPTLLVTAMGQIEDVEKTITTDFKNHNDLIYLIGFQEDNYLTYSEYTRTFKAENNAKPKEITIDIKSNFITYQKMYQAISKGIIKSSHDISEGGLITAVIESAIGGKKGFNLDISKMNTIPFLMNEGTGQFIISINKDSKDIFEKIFSETKLTFLGNTTANYEMTINTNQGLTSLDLETIESKWKGL